MAIVLVLSWNLFHGRSLPPTSHSLYDEILSRVPIVEHSTVRLRRWPERRVAQLARLRDGTCVVNLHASTRPARAMQELERLWPEVLAWAGEDRLIVGGDLNVRSPAPAPPTVLHAAASGVDHVFARGLALATASDSPPDSPAALERPSREIVLDGCRVELSDHAPLFVRLAARAS